MTAGDNVIISAMHMDKSRFVQIMAMAPRFSGRPPWYLSRHTTTELRYASLPKFCDDWPRNQKKIDQSSILRATYTVISVNYNFKCDNCSFVHTNVLLTEEICLFAAVL